MTYDPRTSHQQAFPPLPIPPAIAGPSTYYYTPPPRVPSHTYTSPQRDYHDPAPPPPYEAFPPPNRGYYATPPRAQAQAQGQSSSPSPQRHQQPPQGGRSRGTDYLLSLNTSISNLDLNIQDARVRVNYSPAALSSPSNSPNYNKRLPPLPRPPPFTNSHHLIQPPSIASSSYDAGPSNHHHHLTPPPIPPRPTSLPLPYVQPVSPLKCFKPSIHPHSKPRPSDEDDLLLPLPAIKTPTRPHSDPSLPSSSGSTGAGGSVGRKGVRTDGRRKTKDGSVDGGKRKVKGKKNDPEAAWTPIIDLTLDSDSYDSASDTSGASTPSDRLRVTPRSPARRKRATSEQPPNGPSATLKAIPSSPSPSPGGGKGTTVQCAGFTRTGQPCKRLVKVSAPYLTQRDQNRPFANYKGGRGEDEGDVGTERVLGRYCKDHAGMICQVGGFYWRGRGDKAGVWIDFDQYISPDLGQQTQTLLRMTMESKLTAKETSGFLYAYELKDLETPTLSFFKVGRTDNVPRRIGQWTHQCQSKTPTLRDIFPLPPSSSSKRTPVGMVGGLQRSGTLTTSYLPGATTHLTRPCPAMKRWERLVHLELSERCASTPESRAAFERVRERCDDCGLGHREIFPLSKYKDRDGDPKRDVYELVVEAVCRWERFVNQITSQ
ncbi:hypothetical protein CI109_102238 [Kwoniella shandongensis]|uniref:Bacteriophage T5 Orf172 DNA-binding domain-containing protein n=1 Tax=Kwoniella shandongensis TaxID=1734106 RepID=A0AAJ8LIA4_9TREE